MTVAAPRPRTLRASCRAEFFDDGHLLQGERALEVLPAVQTAAKEEMPFEQRASVAENLQHLVLSSCGQSSGSSFKFQSFEAVERAGSALRSALRKF